MNRITTLIILLSLAVGLSAYVGGETYETLSIGDKAPMTEVKMTDISGSKISLADQQKKNGLLVIFSCNTCPFVIAWEDRYPGLADLAAKKEIGFVLVNSNEAKRSGDDSMDKMKSHASGSNYGNVAYVVDEKSALANAFGAKTTPHVFLFDKDMKLAYEGAIDNNYKSAEAANEHYLENALNNLAAGKKIDPNDTKALGCSIKRVKR